MIQTLQRSFSPLTVRHRVLFPTIYLLFCLSPNTDEEQTTQNDDDNNFTPWDSENMRHTAETLVCLIEYCSQIPCVVCYIFPNLPEQPMSLTIMKGWSYGK